MIWLCARLFNDRYAVYKSETLSTRPSDNTEMIEVALFYANWFSFQLQCKKPKREPGNSRHLHRLWFSNNTVAVLHHYYEKVTVYGVH